MKLNFGKPSEVAGKLHQLAYDTINRVLNEQADAVGIDLAYFNFKITLEWSELSSNDFKPLRVVRVEKTECT